MTEPCRESVVEPGSQTRELMSLISCNALNTYAVRNAWPGAESANPLVGRDCRVVERSLIHPTNKHMLPSDPQAFCSGGPNAVLPWCIEDLEGDVFPKHPTRANEM